jgi:uncharacterized membrane protein YfcA
VTRIRPASPVTGLAFYDQAIALGFVIVVGSALGAWLGHRRIRKAQDRIDRAGEDRLAKACES